SRVETKNTACDMRLHAGFLNAHPSSVYCPEIPFTFEYIKELR
ncbi:31438_t:CDS:1, partial [Racocetra persica]